MKTFKKENGIDLSKDKMAMQRLKECKLKKLRKTYLSMTTTQISAYHLLRKDDEGPVHLDMTLTRAKFEDLCRDLL